LPGILATQEAEVKRILVQSQLGQIALDTPLKAYHKKELMEWLKV
jgi:hypothetical protein